MQIITAFDEVFGDEGKELIDDYKKLFDALLFSGFTVAENVLARVAKTQFRKSLPGCKLGGGPATDWWETTPYWVSSKSVSFRVFALPPSTREKDEHHQRWASYLVSMVAGVVRDVQISMEEGQIPVMAGPLYTSISMVAPEVYKFEMKQRWILHDE